ncbi:MAG: lysophospholipid acyltransferase family protein [Thermoguttaceae bacterium]
MSRWNFRSHLSPAHLFTCSPVHLLTCSPVIDYLVYLGVRIFICIIQSLRIETCQTCAKGLAILACDVLKVRGKLLNENLSHAFPELSDKQRKKLALKMWEHLFMLVAEVAHTPRVIRETNWRKHICLDSVVPTLKLLCSGRPVIIMTGHFGNFELGGYMLGLLGYPTYTVARNLDNKYLDNFIKEFREATGQYIVPKNDGYDLILEVLERNDTMAFLADQSAGSKGCFVDFFGRRVSAYKAIALLCLQFNAPIVVCYAIRKPEKLFQFEMKVSGIFDPLVPVPGLENVKQITQWYTTLLEEGIRDCPDQYWWIHNRWKDKERIRSKADKPTE